MSRKDYPGWLRLRPAAERYGLHYETLRALVSDGVFTRGRFSAGAKQPPIYVRKAELDAWVKGGLDAVRRVQGAAPAKGRK